MCSCSILTERRFGSTGRECLRRCIQREERYKVQERKTVIYKGAIFASLLEEKMCVEDGGEFLVRDEMCLALEHMTKTAERAKVALTVEDFFAGTVLRWAKGRSYSYSTECVRERVCVDGVRVLDEDVRTVVVKSVFISGGSCPNLDDYDGSFNVVKAFSVKAYVKCAQRIYANPELPAQKKMLSSFVLIRGEIDGTDEV